MTAANTNVTTVVTPGACPYCGSYWHSGMCPRIEAIEYHPNGQVAKVTLRDPAPSMPPVQRYEPCVIDFLGRCTRLSHDHSGERATTSGEQS